MNPWLFVFFPMVMAFPAYFAGKKGERAAVATGLVSLAFAFLVALGPDGTTPLPLLTGLKLTVDGFRRVYIVVICLMWAQTGLLSPEYFRHHHHVGRYYFFNLLTLGATLGVFLAADLYTAFVFFEIMSFTSFTWVIQEETPGAIRAANTYLAVAVIGGLVALMGLFLWVRMERFGDTDEDLQKTKEGIDFYAGELEAGRLKLLEILDALSEEHGVTIELS